MFPLFLFLNLVTDPVWVDKELRSLYVCCVVAMGFLISSMHLIF